METYTIGQLARAAGVAVSTVRFYERAGLLKPVARSGANYRVYGAASLERLQFIRSAQAVGLSLDDIEHMAAAGESNQPCATILALAKARLAQVREKIRQLKALEKTLTKAVRVCCDDTDGLCGKIAHLRKICAPA